MVLLQLCHVKPSICITDRNEACIVVYLRTPLHQHDHINIDCVFNRTKPINYLFSLCVTMITTMTMIIQLFQQTTDTWKTILQYTARKSSSEFVRLDIYVK